MTKLKTSDILKEAVEIKAFILRNYGLPKYCTINGNKYSIYTMSYLMSRAIYNSKAPTFNLATMTGPDHNYSFNINEKILKADYLDMCYRFNNYCSKYKKVPSYVLTKKSNKTDYTLFVYCLSKICSFLYKEKYLPNYCIFKTNEFKNAKKTASKTEKNTTTPTSTTKKTSKSTTLYKSQPHLLTTKEGLGQNYPWSCGPNMLQQLFKKLLNKTISEDYLIKVCGTTSSGTGHNQLRTGVAAVGKKYGVKFKVEFKNFSDMGKTIDERFKNIGKLLEKSNIAIGFHIGYQGSGEKATGTIFGHYEIVDTIDVKNRKVRALNSLGYKLNSNAYQGHLQWRPFELQARYCAQTPGGQPSVMIVTKV